MDKRAQITKCLEESGIILLETGEIESPNSISFVAAILALEDEFDIEIGEEYMVDDFMTSIEQIEEVITILLEN